MPCSKCGGGIPGSSGLCPSCYLAAREGLLDPEPKGVAGWLLFFCISLVFFTPFLWFIQISARASDLGILDFCNLTRVVFGVVVGIALWIERPAALILLKAYFLIVMSIMIATMVRFFAVGVPIEIIAGTHLSWFIRNAIYLFLWGLYFHSSQRVKATFGRNL